MDDTIITKHGFAFTKIKFMALNDAMKEKYELANF